MTRLYLFAFLMALVLLHPTPALAYSPISETHPTVCIDREELASVMQSEGGAQPFETQVAIMQIVKREADSRGLTICALTRLTWFVSVRHYAEKWPNSWIAYQMSHPREDALDLADEVMHDRLPDMTGGNMHFDGSSDGIRIIFKP